MKLHMLAATLVVVTTSAGAQVAPATSPIAAPVVGKAILRTGSEVPLKLSEELTTKGKKLKTGQRVHLEVAEPVLVNGVIVVPAGSPAVGEITDVRNKGMWGKSGHFTGRVLYMTVNGRQLRLTGVFDDKGVAGGIGAVATSAIVFLPAGFFMTGTSAKLALGTPVKAFMDEDVPLEMAASTPAPMVVPAAVGSPVLVSAAAVPAAAASAAAITEQNVQTTAKSDGGKRKRR